MDPVSRCTAAVCVHQIVQGSVVANKQFLPDRRRYSDGAAIHHSLREQDSYLCRVHREYLGE